MSEIAQILHLKQCEILIPESFSTTETLLHVLNLRVFDLFNLSFLCNCS